MLAGAIESSVSNRAEAQRFYGFAKLTKVEQALNANAVARLLGPGFAANASRNFIMVRVGGGRGSVNRVLGPAFAAKASRNFIMVRVGGGRESVNRVLGPAFAAKASRNFIMVRITDGWGGAEGNGRRCAWA
jgi:hypothetical protein